MITILYYSVRSGGDGSAYPVLMESSELCEFDQAHLEEGWGEDCSGFFTIESDGPIKIKDEILTIDDCIDELNEDLEYNEDIDDINTAKKNIKKLEELKLKQLKPHDTLYN